MTCHLFLTNYRCCALKECSSKHTTKRFCACFCLSKAPAFHHVNAAPLTCFRFPHPFTHPAVSRSTLSHLLFNLMAILDITAVASHLRRLLVFVPLCGREFLWPWLIDFCPQKQHMVVVCSFHRSAPHGPHSSHFQSGKNNLYSVFFNNRFLTMEIVTLFGTKYQSYCQVTKLFLHMLCSFTR